MKRFNKAGVMVDCSRNAVMTVTSVKKLLDSMQAFGYNFLMLYTEDTYEIPTEPLFGYLRGRYSQAELRQIDAYAKEKGIEVIPCIQTLGHLNQLFVWEKYRKIQDINDILLVGEEETYALIDKMFASMSASLSSRYIHIGMDEAHALGLGKYLDKHGYKNRTELLFEHLIKVCEIAEKYGYTALMWSDMFFRCINDGDYFGEKDLSHLPKELSTRLPKNVELVYWDYYHDKEEDYLRMIEGHKPLGAKTWFAGGIWKWIWPTPSNDLSIRRTKEALSACEKGGVENVMLTIWGDDGNECVFDAILPSLFYAAEAIKGNTDMEDIKKKFFDVYEQSFDDMMLLDSYMSYANKKGIERFSFRNGIKTMLYADPFLGKFDGTVSGDGKEGREFANLAKKLRSAEIRSKHYKLLFCNYLYLCKIMAKKYDLGYRTRKAYQARDKEAIRELASTYGEVAMFYELYLENFERLWLETYKPNGLEVIQIRIGGMVQRLKSCKSRLEGYLSGTVDSIDELDEEIQSHTENEAMAKFPATVNSYRSAFEVGVF